jgi:hypothetical protein
MFIGSAAISQNKTVIPDSRLYQCFEKSYLDNLMKTDPQQILYLNYYLDNSYYVASLKAEKPVTGIDIHSLYLKNKKAELTSTAFNLSAYNKASFNVLKYNFKTGDYETPCYIWKEAGIAIIFRPEKHIREDFEMIQKKGK